MGSVIAIAIAELPDANSPRLHLAFPTQEEKHATWKANFKSWGGALTESQYLEREEYLTTVPLACNGGVTHWILVDSSLPPNERPILGSCETLRKRALVSTKCGESQSAYTHGIGSVFCNPAFRGKGYASRMMKEIGKVLQTWQTTDTIPCLFSVLWSDIGKNFYANHGWHPFPSSHMSILPAATESSLWSKALTAADIKELCLLDETIINEQLACKENDIITVKQPAFESDGLEKEREKKGPRSHKKVRVAIMPDFENMQWHHGREEFLCGKLFNKTPNCKGGIAGPDGKRIWAIWTRSYYGALDKTDSGNSLHILRLVIEDENEASIWSHATKENVFDDAVTEAQASRLKAVLTLAQAQAAEWKLKHIELWNPSQLTQILVRKTGMKHKMVERETDSIASLMWYGNRSIVSEEGIPTKVIAGVETIEWIANEKFAWC